MLEFNCEKFNCIFEIKAGAGKDHKLSKHVSTLHHSSKQKWRGLERFPEQYIKWDLVAYSAIVEMYSSEEKKCQKE